jgi:hypothetical protein
MKDLMTSTGISNGYARAALLQVSLLALSVACASIDSRQPGLLTAGVGDAGGAPGNGADPGAGGAGNGSGETPPVAGLDGGGTGVVAAGEGCAADAGSCPLESPDCVTTGTRDCRSDQDNDCDGQPDDVVDDVCKCVPESEEPCEDHPGLDGRGPCRAGSRTCILGEGNATSDWGACTGAIGPAPADDCTLVGDDSTCDGIPSGGCDCVEGATAACGPNTEDGACARGTSTCLDGAFGPCVGAVFPSARSCASEDDNDCDGLPDNAVDNVCTCVVGDTQVCGEHPGRDGVGQCRAGQRRCELGANDATTRFGACSGSVAPAPQDLCTSVGDDANCDGTACECVPGNNAACAADSRSSRCSAQGQCVPCVQDADCALVSGGRTFCNAGQCISKVGDGSTCREDVECISGVCRQQFPNADGDQFPDMLAPSVGVCGTTALQGRAFARFDGQTDCCDADIRVFPAATPPVPPVDIVGLAGALGYVEANACGDYDYDCDGFERSSDRQIQINLPCTNAAIAGLSEVEAVRVCQSFSSWRDDLPPCGENTEGTFCSPFNGECVGLASLAEPRVCF